MKSAPTTPYDANIIYSVIIVFLKMPVRLGRVTLGLFMQNRKNYEH